MKKLYDKNMTKILVAVIVILTVATTVLLYNVYYKGSSEKSPVIPIVQDNKSSNVSSPVVSSTVASSSSGNPDLDQRLSNLEKSIEDLQGRVAKLEKTPASTVQTTSTSNKLPLYIPLGPGGAATSLDYTTIPTTEVDIDPADYPGYTSMYLEVSLRAYQGNGKAFARLFDNTDGLAVLSSEVSTTSQDYTFLRSGGFRLVSGKKTYRLQLKTLSGYEASTQFARIRVNF